MTTAYRVEPTPERLALVSRAVLRSQPQSIDEIQRRAVRAWRFIAASERVAQFTAAGAVRRG